VVLPLANATPEVLLNLTNRAIAGLTGSVYYDLPDYLALLNSSSGAQTTLAAQIAMLKEQLKVALAAQATEDAATRELLRSTARVCEATDPSDEALLSAGWDLRKRRSPSVVLPAPARLALRPGNFPGRMIARWSPLRNARFYELQIATPEDILVNPDWDLVPIIPSPTATLILPPAVIGKRIHVRVRTVVTKGPSPWTNAVDAIVM
jgi:hypothetical protein